MRMLERNKQTFAFKLLTDKSVPILDPDGYETGEYALAYSEKIFAKANIAHVTGHADERAFGTLVQYDRVICANTDFGMDENSLLWVDDLDSPNNDYIVKRISKSLNTVRIAIARVETSNEDNVQS